MVRMKKNLWLDNISPKGQLKIECAVNALKKRVAEDRIVLMEGREAFFAYSLKCSDFVHDIINSRKKIELLALVMFCNSAQGLLMIMKLNHAKKALKENVNQGYELECAILVGNAPHNPYSKLADLAKNYYILKGNLMAIETDHKNMIRNLASTAAGTKVTFNWN